MKKIKYLLIVFLLISTIKVNASTQTFERTEENLLIPDEIEVTEKNKELILKTPSINEKEKIYDFAELLTEEEEKIIYGKILKYIDETFLDLAIVTINDNNKNSSMEYADDFYDYNFFKENGSLFLIDMDTRNIWISTKGKAITIYTDEKINNINENIYKYFSDEKYNEGITKFIELFKDYESDKKYNAIKKEQNKGKYIIISLVVSTLITLIIMIILVTKNKLVQKATTADSYINNDKIQIKQISDIFKGRHVSKTKIESSSSCGGSSTHTSSSGSSHGGGGHGF